MRDDLHKSVPPRTAWSKVLRLACNHADIDDLRDATVRAVRHDAEWLGAPWGQQFQRSLDLGSSDFFAADRMRAELLALMTNSPNPHARASCEIALGILARDGGASAGFKSIVVEHALRAFAVDCIELVSSRVAARFDESQAAQVRRLLYGLLPTCDFAKSDPSRSHNAEWSIEDGLNFSLSVSI